MKVSDIIAAVLIALVVLASVFRPQQTQQTKQTQHDEPTLTWAQANNLKAYVARHSDDIEAQDVRWVRRQQCFGDHCEIVTVWEPELTPVEIPSRKEVVVESTPITPTQESEVIQSTVQDVVMDDGGRDAAFFGNSTGGYGSAGSAPLIRSAPVVVRSYSSTGSYGSTGNAVRSYGSTGSYGTAYRVQYNYPATTYQSPPLRRAVRGFRPFTRIARALRCWRCR